MTCSKKGALLSPFRLPPVLKTRLGRLLLDLPRYHPDILRIYNSYIAPGNDSIWTHFPLPSLRLLLPELDLELKYPGRLHPRDLCALSFGNEVPAGVRAARYSTSLVRRGSWDLDPIRAFLRLHDPASIPQQKSRVHSRMIQVVSYTAGGAEFA